LLVLLNDFALRAPNFIPARMLRSPITLKSRFHVSGANSPPVSFIRGVGMTR
jgi:hypothetical protein